MTKMPLLLITLMFTALAQAQVVHPETEDEVNSNPTRHLPIDRNADTSGMANPPVTRPMPVPPPFSERFRPSPDNTPAPATTNVPQPGFPGARLTPTNETPAVNLLDIFDKGFTGKYRSCAIHVRRERRGCEYQVVVDGRGYPFHSPEICSSNESAAKVGCNHGSQRENSACILNQALMIGHCR